VVKGMKPVYVFLHFADREKVPNLSEVLLMFAMVRNEHVKVHLGPRVGFGGLMTNN
jgi:hypothetical protein